LAFFQICDFSLGVEPLSSHRDNKLKPQCEAGQLRFLDVFTAAGGPQNFCGLSCSKPDLV
jgi:hypothetical protein